MIRVLVVDDSALMRHRLGTIIGAAPGFEVVGSAGNGQACLTQLARLEPDVITLDVEMPEMDGLSTLRHIMRERPTPVLMISSLTEAGASTTLEALALGAIDYLTKPGAVSTRADDPFGAELLRKLALVARARPSRVVPLLARKDRASAANGRIAAEAHEPAPRPSAGGPPAPAGRQTSAQDIQGAPHGAYDAPLSARQGRRAAMGGVGQLIPLIVVGSSTGGPPALDHLFSALDEELPAALLVVQHMPPLFTKSLAERLSRRYHEAVREGAAGDALVPGTALVAPGGRHMLLGTDRRLRLDDGPPVHGVRPAIDQTLLSVAAHWRGPILAVILTGMGVDGAAGARAVRARGGAVLAQDEESSVIYGMPRAVAEAGLATAVLPLERIGPAMTEWAHAARSPRATSA